MSQPVKKKGRARKTTAVILYVLAGILLLAAAGGYFLRGIWFSVYMIAPVRSHFPLDR